MTNKIVELPILDYKLNYQVNKQTYRQVVNQPPFRKKKLAKIKS